MERVEGDAGSLRFCSAAGCAAMRRVRKSLGHLSGSAALGTNRPCGVPEALDGGAVPSSGFALAPKMVEHLLC